MHDSEACVKVQVLEERVKSLEERFNKIDSRLWAIMFVSFSTLIGVIIK